MTEKISYQDKPWLKHYAKEVPHSIDYVEMCLPDMLEKTAGEFPDRTALICQDYFVTFSELREMVNRFATCLHDFGIGMGDPVAVLLPTCIQSVVAYYAILKLGGIAVMNNPMYADRELKYQYNDSGAKILICLDLLANRMIKLRPETGITHIVYTSLNDYLPEQNSDSGQPVVAVEDSENLYHWKDCMLKYSPDPPEVDLKWDETAVFQYTGGTTGLSKGAILTHRNLCSMIQMYAAWFHDGKKGEETMMAASPVFHILGMQVAQNLSIYMGWRNVLLPKPATEFILEAINKYRPSYSPLVPTHYIGMLQHPDLKDTDLTCFKGAFSGGASLPVNVLHSFEEISKAEICEGFGMSETSPQTHLNPYRGGGPRKPGSIGIPWIDTEVRIVDLETGEKDMPVGEAGEMLFRGPQVTKGYHNKPEETSVSITPDGWLHSGDIARMDEDGYFYVVDRKKDMVISGGYNIYPREVEEVFYQDSRVNKVAVIGIPDEKRGENVKAFVTLKQGEEATTEQLMEFCRERLVKYKWPVQIEIRDSLPESNVGKILKKDLKAEELLKN